MINDSSWIILEALKNGGLTIKELKSKPGLTESAISYNGYRMIGKGLLVSSRDQSPIKWYLAKHAAWRDVEDSRARKRGKLITIPNKDTKQNSEAGLMGKRVSRLMAGV